MFDSAASQIQGLCRVQAGVPGWRHFAVVLPPLQEIVLAVSELLRPGPRALS